ncbi:hypothetical protein B0H14DRAFT_3471623 [Mycena olivaceomarginata]|nr:hypothetical protein B0H14DRAFT_3471623 [Mycena olivaceomarginata]
MVLQQTIWMVGEAVTDIVIATVISWTLFKATKAAVPSTQGIIARSIILTVETNALTAGMTVITLIQIFAFPQHATLVVPPVAIIGKLLACPAVQ